MRHRRVRALALLALVSPVALRAQDSEARRIAVNGVELHYIEQGQGTPLILLHGGQGDYRAWTQHMQILAPQFRVISYSRRNHYPNHNPLRTDYSVAADAADLAGFITELKLGPVHLVGTSYGALTALALSLDHPDMVKSMVLAEPPILSWAAESPIGAPLYRDFMARTHDRARPAFARGDDNAALAAFIDAFDGDGTFARLPDERRRSITQNAQFFKAITASPDPYPNLSKAKVGRLRIPTLVVRGELTHELDIFVSDELVRTLPGARRLIIPGAGHGSPRQNPRAFTAAVLEFLRTTPDSSRK